MAGHGAEKPANPGTRIAPRRSRRLVLGIGRPPMVQRTFGFINRSQRLARRFKWAIASVTLLSVAVLLGASASGRYLAKWLETRARWTVLGLVGLSPGREEIDADWHRKRLLDIEQARSKLRGTYGQYDESMRRLLDYAGLDPDHALLRWGNFDRTIYLPSTVFEPDDTGRSYRFRPRTQSIWIRNLKLKGGILAYFPIPTGPEMENALAGTEAILVETSVQTTNSWGLRGPEPDTSASLRGIVLGDSYMQGLFVPDDMTPPECLKRRLSRRLGVGVEVLNTGHLGYSPEQEYYTLREYAGRIKPHFAVLSLFANDFGDLFEVLDGKGDYEEGKYWLGEIEQFCRSQQMPLLIVPAPWVSQVDGERRSAFYPGRISNIMEASGLHYLDPIEAFTEEYLRQLEVLRHEGKPTSPNPLFNGHVGDGHFSPLGCEVWAQTVAERLIQLLDRDAVAKP